LKPAATPRTSPAYADVQNLFGEASNLGFASLRWPNVLLIIGFERSI
jgi:hypothetical protein